MLNQKALFPQVLKTLFGRVLRKKHANLSDRALLKFYMQIQHDKELAWERKYRGKHEFRPPAVQNLPFTGPVPAGPAHLSGKPGREMEPAQSDSRFA